MRTRQLVRDLIRKTPNPERRYINDRGTLVTIAVRAHHDGLRDERVGRAAEEIFRLSINGKKLRPQFPDSMQVTLDAAQSELKTAKRIAADRRTNPADVCVVHVSPVKMPRQWPNALPGGTSPRRATRALLRLADCEQVDLARCYGDPSAYTANMLKL